MKQKTTQALYAYWNEVRAGRLAPRRLEIEPSRLSPILAETFMLERMDAATYRYRLAGTRLCEIFGTELRETNILDGWNDADRLAVARSLSSMREQGAVVLLTFETGVDTARRVKFEALLLPLIHADGKIGRVIGTMTATTSPHWLGYERLVGKRLIQSELIWPDGRPHAVVERTNTGAPFLAAVRQGRVVTDERRRFRVVDGGRDKS